MNSIEPFRLFGLPTVSHRSLVPLAPVLQSHGPVPDDIDVRLGELGIRARQGDHDAQNALYAAFAPRLDPAVRRAQGNCLRRGLDPSIEPGDIAQQAFVVFVELLANWSGQGSLSGYVIANFPWRLIDAVRLMSHARPRISFSLQSESLLADDSFAGEEAVTLLAVLASKLPAREGQILLLRIRDGLTWGQIAFALDIDKRTAYRDWRRILLRLRTELGPLL